MRNKMLRDHRLLAAAFAVAFAGCSSSDQPAAPSGSVPPLAGKYLLKIDASQSCTAFPVRSMEWTGDAGTGGDAAVFRVVNPDDPGDPTQDHIRLLLRSESGGGLRGELRLLGVWVVVPLETGERVPGQLFTDGLAGATGTLSGTGRPEIRDGRLVGTLALRWGWMGTGYNASCAFGDHAFALVPM